LGILGIPPYTVYDQTLEYMLFKLGRVTPENWHDLDYISNTSKATDFKFGTDSFPKTDMIFQ